MRVAVVNNKSEFVEYVAPAVARYAIKHAFAQAIIKTPFTIRLSPGLDDCPRPPRTAQKVTPEIVHIGAQRDMNYFNPAESMIGAVDFFEKADKKAGGDGIVWAKATAPRGAQVITELKAQNGTRVRLPPIKPGDPICLSKYATFEMLRDAPDLLQNAVNGLIKLMTHTEATEYFQKKATRLGTTPQELMQKSAKAAHDATNHKPIQNESSVDKSQKLSDEYVAVEDTVNPRLHHLCAQVDHRLKDDNRMSVKELMNELLDLEDTLTMDDLMYVQATGYYPTVKKWAEQKLAEVMAASGLLPETDDLS